MYHARSLPNRQIFPVILPHEPGIRDSAGCQTQNLPENTYINQKTAQGERFFGCKLGF
jgi:hypothetical protein